MIDVNIVRETEREYPKLMQEIGHPEYVVLFFMAGVGCVLTDTVKYYVEPYSNGWDMENFEDFTGTLELRNT